MPKTLAEMLNKLEELVDEIEEIQPGGDCDAYVRRELLETLDKAHEMLNCLVEDGIGHVAIEPGAEPAPVTGPSRRPLRGPAARNRMRRRPR